MCNHQIAYNQRRRVDVFEIGDLHDTALSGGSSRIMRGFYTALNNSPIGVKRIRVKETDQMDELKAALTREIAVWCTLTNTSSNILEILGTVTCDDTQVFLPESPMFYYYDNGDLFQYLDKNWQLNDLERLELLKSITIGVNHIHSQNIVHGDLKLGNIVIDHNKQAKICDFGSAFALEGCLECPAGPPEDTRGLATYIYLSPEVWGEDERMSYKSDVWALGCLIFEAQTGGRLYNGEHVNQVMWNMVIKKLPPATFESFSSSEFSKAVGRVALACLSTDPHSRPSAEEALRMLERIG